VWRRTGLSTLALEKLARADAFHALGLDRRQALWAVRGLGAKPLPLFAAADARVSGVEPPVALVPLTAGREVVEDYRATQLSLRAHPLTFLRGTLTGRGIRACGDLQHIRDGARVEVAGIILVRQRPGSAKGVLFITIEDETGIANGILWPDRFDIYRRQIMSASMIAMRGRLQKEGEVIHVICDRIIDHDAMLRSIGRMDFSVAPGRGDGAKNGSGPDPRDPAWSARGRTIVAPPLGTATEQEELLRVRSHDFH
jgi:error-prone DNA polymerase